MMGRTFKGAVTNLHFLEGDESLFWNSKFHINSEVTTNLIINSCLFVNSAFFLSAYQSSIYLPYFRINVFYMELICSHCLFCKKVNEDVALPLPNAIVCHHAGNTLFDASQYAFFGGDVPEEVELGGLEENDDDTALVGFDDEFHLSSFEAREEVSIYLFIFWMIRGELFNCVRLCVNMVSLI